jgi:hypothetical protein
MHDDMVKVALRCVAEAFFDIRLRIVPILIRFLDRDGRRISIVTYSI